MFKNTINLIFKLYCKQFSTSQLYFANGAAANQQSRAIEKLLGSRLKGSKKHRTSDTPHLNTSTSIVRTTTFSKPSGNAKQNIRRINVLNKLFMAHITGFLATGEASQAIIGRGLQVTRVKMAPDFAILNVFWLGNGDVTSDDQLECELQRCSGLLRHELSQLQLMGQVPRIKFVRDKTSNSWIEVETLLSNVRFDDSDNVDIDDDNLPKEIKDYAAYRAEQEKFLEFLNMETENTENDDELLCNASMDEKFPEMRHDVLGLDRRDILDKILIKMRKSRQAWEQHNANMKDDNQTININMNTTTTLKDINQKLTKTKEITEKFDKFLTSRNNRKMTPERKKHFYNDWQPITNNDYRHHDDAMSPNRQKLYDEQDYFNDTESTNRNN